MLHLPHLQQTSLSPRLWSSLSSSIAAPLSLHLTTPMVQPLSLTVQPLSLTVKQLLSRQPAAHLFFSIAGDATVTRQQQQQLSRRLPTPLLATTGHHFQLHHDRENHLDVFYPMAVADKPLVVVGRPPNHCSRDSHYGRVLHFISFFFSCPFGLASLGPA